MIEVLVTAIRKGHIIITYWKLTSKGMKRFPFFFFSTDPTVMPRWYGAPSPSPRTVTARPLPSRSRLAKIDFVALEELFCYISLKKKQPTFLKHQFGYQNCRCGTYHSRKAMAHGHLKPREIYAEICFPS